MAEGNDNTTTGLFHFRHPGAGGFHDVAGIYLASQMAAIPCHDLAWYKCNKADLDCMSPSFMPRS